MEKLKVRALRVAPSLEGKPQSLKERLVSIRSSSMAKWKEKCMPKGGWKSIPRGNSMGTFPPPSSPSPKGESLKVTVKWKDNRIRKRILTSSPTERMSIYLLNI